MKKKKASWKKLIKKMKSKTVTVEARMMTDAELLALEPIILPEKSN